MTLNSSHSRNLSYSASLILKVIADGSRYGFDIMDITGLPSGTVYPALRRLEAAGFVTSRWEGEEIARDEQRPARKYYQISRAGQKMLAEAVARYHALELVSTKTLRKPRASET